MVRGEIKIIKAPQPAWAFCAEKTTNDFLDAFLPEAAVALLHTRAATIGNPEHNENNHPMFFGNTAVVHNGGISNQLDIFKELNVPRSCETDSDVFRAILDKEGMTRTALKTMNKLNGSAAIAAVSQADPSKLLLARSGSPLTYGITEDKLWWASEVSAIQRAVRPWEQHHGLYGRKFRADVAYFGVPDHTAYLLGEEGLDAKFEFKTCLNYRAPVYNMRDTYADKQAEFKRTKRLRPYTPPIAAGKKRKAGKCSKAGCDTMCIIDYDLKFKDFSCPKCHVYLGALDAIAEKDLIITID